MLPEHLDLIPTLSTPTVHPSEGWAAVAVTRPVLSADRYSSQLWRVELDGTGSRALTRGVGDSDPRFTPDGAHLLFLREDAKGRAQLAVVESRGGEPWVVTDAPQGVREFQVSPDGRWVAWTAGLPAAGRAGTLPDVPAQAEAPRRITDMNYQANGAGFLDGRAVGLYVMPFPEPGAPHLAPSGEAARDAEEPFKDEREAGAVLGGRNGLPLAVRVFDAGERRSQSPSSVNWAQDSHSLRFLLPANAERTTLASELREVRLDSLLGGSWPATEEEVAAAEPQESITLAGAQGQGAGLEFFETVSSGGRSFLLGVETGEDGLHFAGRNPAVYLRTDAHEDEPGSLHRLSDPESEDYTALTADVGSATGSVLAAWTGRGSVGVHRLDADGNVSVLLQSPLQVTGMASGGEHIVVAYSDPEHSAELGLLTPSGLTRLSHFSEALNDAAAPLLPVELSMNSADGYPVHGWVFVPEGQGPHPVLLNIHGGPFADFGWGWFDEAQVYARAGYAVVQCNPRGSAGYGQAHGQSILGAMGTVDEQDVLAFLDGAVAKLPALDGERVGVMGGSYGGFLTAWITTRHHRFAAAIVERGFLDPVSFAGTSDIGSFFGANYVGTDPERVAAQSPMAHVSQVRTPTLVIHSERDLRCPMEQGQRWFAGLQAQGVASELLLFPGEDHELTRSGSPRHRRERFEAVLEWWGRHLPVRRD